MTARVARTLIALALLWLGLVLGAGAGLATAAGPDPSFGVGGRTEITQFFRKYGPSSMVAGEGSIYVGGQAGTLRRFDEHGSPDMTFGRRGGYGLTIYTDHERGGPSQPALFIQRGGRLLMAGSYGPRPVISRQTTDGFLDLSFGDRGAVMDRRVLATGPQAEFTDVAVTDKGRIYGTLVQWRRINGEWLSWSLVRRYLPDGRPDLSFGKRGKVLFKGPRKSGVYFSALELSKGGRIIVLGSSSRGTAVMALNSRGKVIRSFARGKGSLRVPFSYKLDTASSGRITAFGVSSGSGGGEVAQSCARLYAFNWAGVRSSGFSKDGLRVLCPSKFDSMFPPLKFKSKGIYQAGFGLQGNGKSVVALGLLGRPWTGGSYTVRFNPDGSLDRSLGDAGLFRTGTPSGLLSVEGLDDGVLIVAGDSEFETGPSAFVYRFDG